jgi:Cu(I)/Ag(I) efflux system membrane fusion protein
MSEQEAAAEPAKEASTPELAEGEEAPPRGTRVMAVLRWVLVVAAAAAALKALHAYEDTGATEHTEAAQIYYCPMHPQIVQDHPGTCPICHMTLVPRTQAAAPAAATPSSVPGLAPVQLAPERVQLIGLKTAHVTRGELVPELRATGVVSVNERGLARVHARVSGFLEELLVEETGKRVARGQVLGTLYSQELVAAQQELLTAVGWERQPSAKSDPLLGRNLAADARKKLELLGVAVADIDAIVAQSTVRQALPLRAPASGHVTRKGAVQGMYVEPGTELFEIADLSRVWVIVDVPEQDMQRVVVGAVARMELSALPGQTFEGKVQFLYPELAAETRSLRARLEFGNQGLALRPGMFGEVLIALPAASGLVVPAEAVVDTGHEQYVFLALPEGRFQPRAVRLGARGERAVQVLEGVNEGDTVVTTANFLLDSESRLQATLSEHEVAPGTNASGGTTAPKTAPSPRRAPAPAGGHRP